MFKQDISQGLTCDMGNLTNKYVAADSQSERKIKPPKSCKTKSGCFFLRYILPSKSTKSSRFNVGFSLVLDNDSVACHPSRSTGGKEKRLPLELV